MPTAGTAEQLRWSDGHQMMLALHCTVKQEHRLGGGPHLHMIGDAGCQGHAHAQAAKQDVRSIDLHAQAAGCLLCCASNKSQLQLTSLPLI